MKQKFFITALSFSTLLLFGCQQATAPSPQNQAMQTSETSQNEAGSTHTSVTIAPQNEQGSSGPSQTQTTPGNISTPRNEEKSSEENTNSAEQMNKISIMLKMIGDGLNISKNEKTQRQGIAMIERGYSLLMESAKSFEMLEKVTSNLETMQKSINLMKEDKTLKEGQLKIEKTLSEIKSQLQIQ